MPTGGLYHHPIRYIGYGKVQTLDDQLEKRWRSRRNDVLGTLMQGASDII